ncbi:MAG: hydrogenase maturation nickel metallochaperone HypA [Syntrophomonadales bacterium]|jgi:hydrogenase nickel incorporation protein HypA/HybF
MHEVGLMENVLQMVQTSARDQGLSTVRRIKLVVGELSMALPESLRFAFAALVEHDMFQGMFHQTVLEIEERPLECQCGMCGHRFPGRRFTCPLCRADQVRIVSGRELYVDYYEGEALDDQSRPGT